MRLQEALQIVRAKLSKLNSTKKGQWTLKERAAVSLLALTVERIVFANKFEQFTVIDYKWHCSNCSEWHSSNEFICPELIK